MDKRTVTRFFIGVVGIIFGVMLVSAFCYAVPQTMNYQGYLTDSEGNPLDGSVNIVFSLYNVSSGGSPLWTETQTGVDVTEGIFSVNLGSVTPINLLFNTQYYLGITVGADAEMTPRQALTSVGYSFMADTADEASDLNCTGCVSESELDFTPFSTSDDYGRSGVSPTLFEGSTPLSSKYAPTTHTHDAGDITTGELSTSRFSAYGDLGAEGYLNNDDGADLLTRTQADGRYATSGHTHDHGLLTGLSDDDHPQYLLVNGSRAMTGGLEAYSITVGNVSSPSAGDVAIEHDLTCEDDLDVGKDATIGDDLTVNSFILVPSGGISVGGSSAAAGEVAASGDIYCGGSFLVEHNANILGNLYVWGGTKNAVVDTINYGTRLTYAVESTEVWFEDFGSGQLENGVVTIQLDPIFLETVTIDADHPMKVFVTLTADCSGVYVVKGSDSFQVRELNGGTSNATFDYRIAAKRKGYEDERLRELVPESD